jgi:hypothetical protein
MIGRKFRRMRQHARCESKKLLSFNVLQGEYFFHIC